MNSAALSALRVRVAAPVLATIVGCSVINSFDEVDETPPGNSSAGNSQGGSGVAGVGASGGTSSIDSGGDSNLGGEGGGSGCDAASSPVLGECCTTNGALACQGQAQKLSLLCAGGVWTANETCGSNENCNNENGACAAIDPLCADRAPSEAFCSSGNHVVCGSDLVSSEMTACDGLCDVAGCAPAGCGDGIEQVDEPCEDGNNEGGDGCSPTCQPEATSVMMGTSHTCALLTDGNMKCWGFNSFGRLGNGTEDNSLTPVPVNLSGPAQAFSAGAQHTCALMEGGSIECWGRNEYGQLGTDDIADRANPVPVKLADGEQAKAVACGMDHTCAILTDGSMRCWGGGHNGEIGNGDSGSNNVHETPVAVESLGGEAIAAVGGEDHSCALLVGGSAQCWGANTHGQIGNDGFVDDVGSDVVLPDDVALGTSKAQLLSAGRYHTCGLMTDNSVWCWGLNSSFQLGRGATVTKSDIPLSVKLGTATVQALSAGYDFTCIMRDQEVVCWGNNAVGQLGQNGITNSAVPLKVLLDAKVKTLAYGMRARHMCAIFTDGKIRCWGNNAYGQLGTGDTQHRGDHPDEMANLVPVPL